MAFALNKSSLVSLYEEYKASKKELKQYEQSQLSKDNPIHEMCEVGMIEMVAAGAKQKVNKNNTRKKKNRRISRIITSRFHEKESIRLMVNVLSPVTIIVGIILLSYVAARYNYQKNACIEKLGLAAKCFYPALYFRNGFFKETT